MSRNPREPAKRGPSGAERWADYLDWMREDKLTCFHVLAEYARHAGQFDVVRELGTVSC